VFANSTVKKILCLRAEEETRAGKIHDLKSQPKGTGVFRSGRMRRVSHMIGTGGSKIG